jgi:hypothetical protein
LGIKVKPSGNRRLQPVVDKFFFWLRASVLETNRLAYWWANRMVASPEPLREKIALFWHGHFAVNEAKVRDYRKLRDELALFQQEGTGNFRKLMIAVAQDPAMLTFLDAGVNVKGAANENFAREIMELFTMGVGNYTEKDVREGARAFTGWNYVDLKFLVNKDKHDDGEKTFLGKSGRFDGVDVIKIIMDQPVTADFIAGKIYRFFVQPGVRGDADQEPGATGGFDVPEVGAQERAGCTGFQRGDECLGAAALFPADRGRLGRGSKLDHARAAAGTREFRTRRALPGH